MRWLPRYPVIAFIVTAITFSLMVTTDFGQNLLDKVAIRLVELINVADEVLDNEIEQPNQTAKGDRKTCSKCHFRIRAEFRKEVKHAPFMNWQCTSCHIPHPESILKAGGEPKFVVEIDKLCLSCHFGRNDEMTMPVKHPPFADGKCVDCHNPHASDHPKLLRMAQQDLCQSCHAVVKRLANLPNKHAPFAKGFCTDCHVAHAGPDKGLIRLPEKKLCYSCHQGIMSEMGKPVKHMPVEKGSCTVCHGPHATEGEKMLRYPKEKLCFSCHIEKAEQTKIGYQHPPFEKGLCTGCHTPHSSSYVGLLLDQASELCYNCHEGERQYFKMQSHHPVDDVRLSCRNCHNPHSGPGKRMTLEQGNNLCYMCHGKLRDVYDKYAHSSKAVGKNGNGSCLNCHVPHGAKYKPLFDKQQKNVCVSCHGSTVMKGFQHATDERYTDPWRGGPMRCGSCHDPHGNDNKGFTRLPQKDLCLKCHGVIKGKNVEIYKILPAK